MEGTVYLKEIDKALYDLIQETVKLDIDGTLTSLTVIPKFPDKDLLDKAMPCASLFNYDQKGKLGIPNQGKVLVSVDKNLGVGVLCDTPQEYNLFYQIDFWSNYQEDINEITLKWLTKVKKFDTLTVVDSKGVVTQVNMTLVQYANLDKSLSTERTFRRTYSYKISSKIWGDTPQERSLNTVTTLVTKKITGGSGI